MNTPNPSLDLLPVWVTLGEAAFLTGLSEGDLRARVESGALTVTAVRQRRGSPPLQMVRSADLRRLGLLASSEEAGPPAKEAPAGRRGPWSWLARPVVGLWVATVAGASALAVLLAAARGGQILQLPTVESELGLQVDRQSLDRLVEGRLGGFGRQLVRVAVLNGDGRPGIGARISEILAPAGFRVVTAQNISSHDVEHTQIAASTEDLLPLAEQAGRMLGVGEVFAGPQPTGIADLTIVVGHDFAAGSPAAIESNSNSD